MSLFDSASLVVTPNGVKEGKLYSIKPTDGSGDLSVTRATTATRVNSSGLISSVATNVPRLDYTNGTCPSILVEPQRTNLFTYSEQFDNAAWSKYQATVTANDTTSPDGTTTADKLASSTGATAVLYRTASTGAAAATISVYSKAGTNDILDIGFTNVSDYTVKANLTTGTITSATSGITGTITNVGNGWYRVTATRNMTASGTGFINNANTVSGRYIHIWGGQLEVGSYATSYIPTVASSVTRNADVISKTGISSLIGQTEGTIFIDANLSTRSNTRFLLDIQNGSNTDAFQFALSGNNLSVNIYDNGTLQAALNGGSLIGRKKIALGYKANDFVLYVNGVQLATDISGTVPTASLIALGYLYIAGGYELGDSINSSALWTTRLTNAELATLTTI